jgi:preprotein translocase subunit SecD
MAVLIDGDVVMAPTIRAPISESAVLNGVFSEAQAKQVADGIARP